MSIFTICFQAVNRSMRMSEGLSSWLLVFFWLRGVSRDSEGCQTQQGSEGGKTRVPGAAGRRWTYIRDLFLETVETLDSVLEMVSNLDMVDSGSLTDKELGRKR